MRDAATKDRRGKFQVIVYKNIPKNRSVIILKDVMAQHEAS